MKKRCCGVALSCLTVITMILFSLREINYFYLSRSRKDDIITQKLDTGIHDTWNTVLIDAAAAMYRIQSNLKNK